MCEGVECHVPVSSTTKTTHTLPLSSVSKSRSRVSTIILLFYKLLSLYCCIVRMYEYTMYYLSTETHNKISNNFRVFPISNFSPSRSAEKMRREPQMGFFASVSFEMFWASHHQHCTGFAIVQHRLTARRQVTVVQCTMLPKVDKTEIIIHKWHYGNKINTHFHINPCILSYTFRRCVYNYTRSSRRPPSWKGELTRLSRRDEVLLPLIKRACGIKSPGLLRGVSRRLGKGTKLKMLSIWSSFHDLRLYYKKADVMFSTQYCTALLW